MKRLICAIGLTLTFCFAAVASAETPESRYAEISILWSTNNWHSFQPSCGGQNITFYMAGDCLVIKDVCNDRTWLIEGHAYKYIDAKKTFPPQ